MTLDQVTRLRHNAEQEREQRSGVIALIRYCSAVLLLIEEIEWD